MRTPRMLCIRLVSLSYGVAKKEHTPKGVSRE